MLPDSRLVQTLTFCTSMHMAASKNFEEILLGTQRIEQGQKEQANRDSMKLEEFTHLLRGLCAQTQGIPALQSRVGNIEAMVKANEGHGRHYKVPRFDFGSTLLAKKH